MAFFSKVDEKVNEKMAELKVSNAIKDLEKKKATMSNSAQSEINNISNQINAVFCTIGENAYSQYKNDGFTNDKLQSLFGEVDGLKTAIEEKTKKLVNRSGSFMSRLFNFLK